MLEAWGLPLTELLRMVLRAILIAALVTAAYYLVVKYKVFAAVEPQYGVELKDG
jgi:predicted secreted protein